jgi:2OG-Fe(II) oxygenase superfamily
MAPKSKSKSESKSSKPHTSTIPCKPAETPTQRPDWPPLTPLIPTQDLTVTTLLPNQVLLIPNLFTSTLCRAYTASLSTLPLTAATPGKPKRGEALRANDRYRTHDRAFAHNLWTQTALQELVTGFADPGFWGGRVLGLNPNVRVYRYRPGQFFDRHYDESNRLAFGDPPVQAKTTWTLLIYLSRCDGGETVFYPGLTARCLTPEREREPVAVEVVAGLALLHRHGDECLLHEGREVKGGEKWVLRSDLVVE